MKMMAALKAERGVSPRMQLHADAGRARTPANLDDERNHREAHMGAPV
jgi:hypothetical protein